MSVAKAFAAAYRRGPDGVWEAPGRVNVIGEHTDYSDGFVLPLALPQRVRCAAAVRTDSRLRVRSMQAPGESVVVSTAALEPSTVDGWAAYLVGVVWALRSVGHGVGGMDLLIDGDVPLGAGLSSSAALECSIALACNDLFGLRLSRTELALAAQRAENDFVGAPVGIMDQMAAMHGRAGHVLFLDTRSLLVEPVPFDLDAFGLALLVIDTRARHAHVDSEYAARRRDCEAAARSLGVRALRDVALADLDALSDSRIRSRARHVVSENARVLDVAAALQGAAGPRAIGPLLTASHASLRNDFEVSCAELDCAVDAALAAGAHGARMTGGGFGGCAIALVDAAAVDSVSSAVLAAFAARGFAEPSPFVATPSDGAHRVA